MADYCDYVNVWCQVEASLQHVMPFGWQREWVQGEQANQDDEGEYLYRRRDVKGESSSKDFRAEAQRQRAAMDSSLAEGHRRRVQHRPNRRYRILLLGSL